MALKRYERLSHYPARLNVGVSDAMMEALEAVSEKADIPAAEAAWRCIEKGLPAMRQSLKLSRSARQS